MPSFFAMAWDTANQLADRTARTMARSLPDPRPGAGLTYEEDGFLLACLDHFPEPASIIPLGYSGDGFSGAIYGTLFRKSLSPSGEKRILRLEPQSASRITKSNGDELYSAYWGSYIAFIRTQGQILVLSDPTASIPCLYTQQNGITLLFSHLEKCPFIDRHRFTVNEDFIARLLVYDKIQTGETGLNEVRDLGAGEKLCPDQSRLRTALAWDPRIVARDRRRLSPEQAADELRETCDHVVRSWASCFRHVSVSLSGGLDSAIVLSCLAQAKSGPDISAFHNTLESDDFPELEYAKEAAMHSHVPMRVIRSSPIGALKNIDAHPPTARPTRSFLTPSISSPIDDSNTCQTHAAVFTGQGGDHVFHARQSPLIFADHVFNNGLSGRTVSELLNASRLSGDSIWVVLQTAINQKRATEAEGIEAALLARQVRMAGMSLANLPLGRCFPDWTERDPDIAPLKSVQIGSLAHFYQGRRHSGQFTRWHTVDPLGSQPLIELCLRLPTYLLCHNGIPRGLARQAFRDRLPDSIRRRTSKGSASGYFAEQLGENLKQVISALAEGELVRRGLISPSDIALLSAPGSPQVRILGRTLLSWYVVEAWLRCWKNMPAR